MSLYTLIIVTFIVFMAINVIIGLRGRKHASTTKDFLTASGQSGIWFIIASAVGASIGSGVVIGTTQYAVKLGVAGAWYAIACGLACLVHAFVMTRFIYRNKLVSFSDYFKRRYDSNFIILLYSGIGPFACAASMGGQLVAAKAIFQAFGIDPTIGLVITAAVMLVYTMFAGLWGSYATAVFQVGVIIVGVLVVGISMFTQGGIIWKRGTTKGAAASAAVGMITALLSIFGVITVPFSSIFPVLPGAVTYIVVSLCTKHAPTENTAKVADVVMASTSEKSNNAAN